MEFYVSSMYNLFITRSTNKTIMITCFITVTFLPLIFLYFVLLLPFLITSKSIGGDLSGFFFFFKLLSRLVKWRKLSRRLCGMCVFY